MGAGTGGHAQRNTTTGTHRLFSDVFCDDLFNVRRDSLLKLDVAAPGMLNAVVFWFDLHLDDMETLSNGEKFVVEQPWEFVVGGVAGRRSSPPSTLLNKSLS